MLFHCVWIDFEEALEGSWKKYCGCTMVSCVSLLSHIMVQCFYITVNSKVVYCVSVSNFVRKAIIA